MKFNRYLLFIPLDKKLSSQAPQETVKKEYSMAWYFSILTMASTLALATEYRLHLFACSIIAFSFLSKEFCIIKLSEKESVLSFSKADTKYAVNIDKISFAMTKQQMDSWITYFNFCLLAPIVLSFFLNYSVLFTSFGDVGLYVVHRLEVKESVISNELSVLKSKLEKRNKAQK